MSAVTANLFLGIVCVVLGVFIAYYAGGYERGNEYKRGQYVIETFVCFGLFILAFVLVGQGAILITFRAWII